MPGGGEGGGALIITAAEDIHVAGEIRSNGFDGEREDTPSSCLVKGSGGGAGGGIEIDALRVTGFGMIMANGGDGGSGGETGGGGAGGHVTINAIVRSFDDDDAFFPYRPFTEAEAGDAGEPDTVDGGDCDEFGDGGSSGDPYEGDTFERGAFVTLNEANPGPVQQSTSVKLDLRAIQMGGEEAGIVLCRYDADANEPNGLGSPALDPPDEADPFDVFETADDCEVHHFSGPTTGTDEYRRTITTTAPDGWHGWVAMAFYDNDPDDDDCVFIPLAGCLLQPTAPQESPATIGIDRSAPFITHGEPFAVNGVEGCPDDTRCLDTQTAQIDAPLSDPMAGLAGTRCFVNGVKIVDSCQTTPLHNVPLPAGDGIKEIDLRAFDRLGNFDTNLLDGGVHHDPLARFFLDTKGPDRPDLDPLDYGADPAVNGWHKVKPSVHVSTDEHGPSSGFGEDPITVYVDGTDEACGAEKDGTIANSATIHTACDPSEVDLPATGKHELLAVAEDRAGNVSPESVTRTMKVDVRAPTSKLFLTPSRPDGDDPDWFKTAPLFAFATDDNPGGSGVDARKDHDGAKTGVWYRFDDAGPWQPWDPSLDNLLPQGRHSICWYAVDVAGNKQDPRCREDIRVDSVAPNVADELMPALPNGDNSFYVTKPTIDPSAVDPLGPGVNQRSGVNRTQFQIDGGPWRDHVLTTIAEGTHEVRVRAFDDAGNTSEVSQRPVRVDTSLPSARFAYYPPAPNAQGWWRQSRLHAVSVSDGRDSSGADGATYRIDAGGPVSYLEPFPVTDGVHAVTVNARDYAGHIGAPQTGTDSIDTQIPSATPTGQTPLLTIPLLGLPKAVPMQFNAADQLSPRVKVRVMVHDVLGNLVRTLPATGPHPEGYRDNGAGQVLWDGRDERNRGVLPGVYYYRVGVVDQAGNTMVSSESSVFVVVLGLLPL